MDNKSLDRSKEQSHKDCFLLLKNNIFLLLGMSIAVAICMYGILGIFGFSAFPDEFGYWSPAAAILGYDWSEITGLGSYYSYGYSALLVPILLLFHNAITTYRAAIVLNLVLQCLSMVLLFLIARELFPKENRNVLAIIAAIAALYPAWMFYVNTTMAEALLYFGLILSIYLMFRFVKKPGVLFGILYAILLVYLYMVHMRCIGTIAAGLITIIIWAVARTKNHTRKGYRIWILIALVIALFAGTFLLKDKIIQILYHRTSSDILSWNDYSGLAYRIKKIISLQGFTYLVKDICGKVLYLGLATFGTAYFGIALCVRKFVSSFVRIRKRKASYTDFLWIYILLIIVFQFLVALVYLNGASAPEADRLDNFLHGRYIDFFIPILFVLGFEEMLSGEKTYLGMAIVLLMYLGLGFVAYRVIAENNLFMRNAHGFTMVGMSYFIEYPFTDTFAFFRKELLLQIGLTFVGDLIIIMCRRFRQRLLVALFLIIQVSLGVVACTKFIFLNQSYIYEDVRLADVLNDVTDMYPDKKVVHIYEGEVPYIQLVQFGSRDTDIQVVNGDEVDVDINEYLRDDTILITCECQDYAQQVRDYYDEEWMLGHLRLYYNQ